MITILWSLFGGMWWLIPIILGAYLYYRGHRFDFTDLDPQLSQEDDLP